MNIFRKIVFITITIILTVFTNNFLKEEGVSVNNKYVYGPVKSDVYYEYLTNNTGITSREAINNVWYNLDKDGYTLSDLKEDKFYVDAVFTKGSDTWRYIYDVESNYIMFFNKEYESSYKGESYINEGKENK